MRFKITPILFFALTASALVGCGEEPEITSYTTDKPGHLTPQPPDRQMPGNHPPPAETSNAGNLQYQVPDAWTQTSGPGAMGRVGVFTFGEDQAGVLKISRFNLDYPVGLMDMNRWHGIVGLDAPAAYDPTVFEMFDLPIGTIRTLDLVGPENTEGPLLATRIAVVPVSDDAGTVVATWFFRIEGPKALIDENHRTFDDMLRTIRPGNTAHDEEVSDDD